jgi:hypothetical protein
MPQRLEVLKGLSEDEQLRTYVRELDFGPEVLNTNLEVDLQYVREQWEEPSTGCPHPESYIYVDSARPIWPIVKLSELLWEGNTGRDSGPALVVRWNERDGYSRWLQKHGGTLRRLIDHQDHPRTGTGCIRGAIANFPMLNGIKINPRPVGTSYDERFANTVNRSKGTMPLLRELGADELELTADPATYGSKSILKFSFDGLLFTEYYAKIIMLENLSEVLSSAELSKFTVDLTVTATNLPSNGKISDTNHRVRSPTFDFAMSDINRYQVLPLLTWIAEIVSYTNGVEHFYGRNLSFGYFALRRIPAQSSWTSLRTLHLFQCRIHGRDLRGLFLRHRSTLEDASFSHVATTGMSVVFWRDILVAMKGMGQLAHVTLDRLGLEGVSDMSSNASYICAPKSATSCCVKAKGHGNACSMLDVATERIILLPGRMSRDATSTCLRAC